MLQALPFFDKDTTQKPISPVIKEEGRDPMTGDEMTYNLKTKKDESIIKFPHTWISCT